MKAIQKFVSNAIRAVQSALTLVVAIFMIVWVWTVWPSFMLAVMNWNIQFLKWATSFLGPDLGSQVESAFRIALAGDRMLLIIEAVLFVKILFFAVKWSIWKSVRTFRKKTSERIHAVAGKLAPA